MKTQILGFLLPLVAIAAVVRPADAQSVSIGTVQPEGFTTPFSVELPQYDGSIPLEYVVLSITDGSSTFVVDAINQSYPSQTENAQVTASQPLTLDIGSTTVTTVYTATGTSTTESIPGYNSNNPSANSVTLSPITSSGSGPSSVISSSLNSLFVGNSDVTITINPDDLSLVGTTNSGPDIVYEDDEPTNGGTYGDYNSSGTTGNLTVTYIPVPEPLTTAGTLAAGAMGLWLKRRRKKAV